MSFSNKELEDEIRCVTESFEWAISHRCYGIALLYHEQLKKLNALQNRIIQASRLMKNHNVGPTSV